MTDPAPAADQLWIALAQLLRAQVSEAVWLSTFQDVRASSLGEDRLTILAPSAHVRERITTRYLPILRDALDELGRGVLELSVELEPEQVAFDLSDTAPVEPERRTERTGERGRTGERRGDGDLPWADLAALRRSRDDEQRRSAAERAATANLNTQYTFDSFVTGASNRFAQAAALRVAEMPAKSYNPLFIYGSAGLGKTHMLQAIGNYVVQNYAHYTVRYVSTETFLNEYVDSIRTNSGAGFKRRYREVDVLLIDDIQFMEGKEGLQEEFFHTFNSLHGASKQIVISSDRNPDAIQTLEDRLRSRFKWGLITDIQPPDLETRLAILRTKAERETVVMPHDVLELIATNITTNIRELEGALIRVTAFASLTREPVDTAMASRVLADMLGSNQPRPVTPQLILGTVAESFDFTVDMLRGKSRARPLVTARQIAMYLFREMTDLSYPAIAREFGGRDHTTVMHAVEKITRLMKEKQSIFDQVTDLAQRIKTRP